jgi:uncharacterized protein involved in exopolysaccharide biosynthesis
MSEQSNTNSTSELTIFDFLKFLINGWKVFLASILVSVSVGAGYAFLFMQEKFQASATMEMASVQGGAVGADGSALILLEKPNNLVEKLKLPLFYSEKTIEKCQLKNHASANQSLSKMIKSTLAKNTNYVTISYVGITSTIAIECLSAVVEDIKNDQAKIVQPILVYRKTQIELLKNQLKEALLLNNKSAYFYSQQTLTNEIDRLSLQLATIKNAEILTPIFSPQNRVEPTPAQILLISLMLGIFIGLVILKLKKFFK